MSHEFQKRVWRSQSLKEKKQIISHLFLTMESIRSLKSVKIQNTKIAS